MLSQEDKNEIYNAARPHLTAIVNILELEKENDILVRDLVEDITELLENTEAFENTQPLDIIISELEHIIEIKDSISDQNKQQLEKHIDMIFRDHNVVKRFLDRLVVECDENPEDVTKMRYFYQENTPVKMIVLKNFLVDELDVKPVDDETFWDNECDPEFYVKPGSLKHIDEKALRTKWLEEYANQTTIKQSALYRNQYKVEEEEKELEDKIERDIAFLDMAVKSDNDYAGKRKCVERLKVAAPLLDIYMFSKKTREVKEFLHRFENGLPESLMQELKFLKLNLSFLEKNLNQHDLPPNSNTDSKDNEKAEYASHTNHPKEQFKGALKLLNDWDSKSDSVPFMLLLMCGVTDNAYETKKKIDYKLTTAKWIDDIYEFLGDEKIMDRLLKLSSTFNEFRNTNSPDINSRNKPEQHSHQKPVTFDHKNNETSRNVALERQNLKRNQPSDPDGHKDKKMKM